MLFNSFLFILFLLVVFTIYWSIPNKYRWVLLLISSYYFYMSWNAKYVVLIIFTTIISYGAARIIGHTDNIRIKKLTLSLSIIVCLFVLFIFKYFNFFIENLTHIASFFSIKLHPTVLKLLLPVGISFYTFQTISYVIDVYTGKIEAELNIGVYATFVSFFPQLVAGPIERTSNLLPQIKGEHTFDSAKAIRGAELMIWGYFKKLVIADTVAVYVDAVYSSLHNYVGFDLLLVIFLFTFQIYCDFSGYSDIAIGTAKLLDIDLMTNFKSPYLAGSVREFWSRWHISLSTWFRDYIYIPLGGNRVGKMRNYMNIMITFLVSGLWHGANWTFVLWGGLHGLAEIIEIMVIGRNKEQKNWIMKIICVIIVFIFCNLAWVLFRANKLSDVSYVFTNILMNITNPAEYFKSNLLSMNDLIYIFVPIVVLMIYDYIDKAVGFQTWIHKQKPICIWIIYVFIGLMVVFFSRKGVATDFVYFQF